MKKKEHINIANALIDRETDKLEKLIADHIKQLEDRVYSSKGGRI